MEAKHDKLYAEVCEKASCEFSALAGTAEANLHAFFTEKSSSCEAEVSQLFQPFDHATTTLHEEAEQLEVFKKCIHATIDETFCKHETWEAALKEHLQAMHGLDEVKERQFADHATVQEVAELCESMEFRINAEQRTHDNIGSAIQGSQSETDVRDTTPLLEDRRLTPREDRRKWAQLLLEPATADLDDRHDVEVFETQQDCENIQMSIAELVRTDLLKEIQELIDAGIKTDCPYASIKDVDNCEESMIGFHEIAQTVEHQQCQLSEQFYETLARDLEPRVRSLESDLEKIKRHLQRHLPFLFASPVQFHPLAQGAR